MISIIFPKLVSHKSVYRWFPISMNRNPLVRWFPHYITCKWLMLSFFQLSHDIIKYYPLLYVVYTGDLHDIRIRVLAGIIDVYPFMYGYYYSDQCNHPFTNHYIQFLIGWFFSYEIPHKKAVPHDKSNVNPLYINNLWFSHWLFHILLVDDSRRSDLRNDLFLDVCMDCIICELLAMLGFNNSFTTI